MSEPPAEKPIHVLKAVPIPPIRMDQIEQIKAQLDALSPEERAKVQEYLAESEDSSPNFAVVFGASSNIINSVVFQLNGSSDDIAQKLKDVPAEALGGILEAIALRIRIDAERRR